MDLVQLYLKSGFRILEVLWKLGIRKQAEQDLFLPIFFIFDDFLKLFEYSQGSMQ